MATEEQKPASPWPVILLMLGGAAWYAIDHSLIPLAIVLGIACGLFSLRCAEQGEARYGRRVPVTEMIGVGRQGDRAMLLGGIAGYLMLGCFILAGWLAF